MRFVHLDEWLGWQQGLHPSAIDLSLDRVQRVLGALGLGSPAHPVITVGGTNGKGSVVAMLASMLRAAGYQAGVFTSPHLLRYHERIRVGGVPASDADLMSAFARIDAARGDVSLTFFEWNTLAALLLFAEAHVDVAVLEVGLGGRLDAVNAVDADVAVVVSVGLDHCEWLGSTREDIGREKAGIFRPGRPAIFGARLMPDSIGEVAVAQGARLMRLGVDFDFVERPDGWDYVGTGTRRADLPMPAISGVVQLANAATALAALDAAEPRLLVPDDAVRAGLAGARLAGRFQVVAGDPEWILDVAHNPDAAAVLARSLAGRPCRGRTIMVCGILRDKDVEAIAGELAHLGHHWIAVGLEGDRGLPAAELAARLRSHVTAPLDTARDVGSGCDAAAALALPGDRIVVFGSFHTVGPALSWHGLQP